MCVYTIFYVIEENRRRSLSMFFAFSLIFFDEDKLFVLILIIYVLNVLYILTSISRSPAFLVCWHKHLVLLSYLFEFFQCLLSGWMQFGGCVYMISLATYVYVKSVFFIGHLLILHGSFMTSLLSLVCVFIRSFGQTDRHGSIDKAFPKSEWGLYCLPLSVTISAS